MGDPVKKRGWIFGNEEHAAAETEAAPVVESVYQRALKRQYGGEEAKPEVVESVMTVGAPEVIKGPTKADDFELSPETDERAAETAPSNVENKPEEPKPWYSTLLDTVRATPGPGDLLANDAARGLAGGFHHGMTMGATKLLPGQLGDAYKELDADALSAAPSLYNAADIGGGMANPLRIVAKGGRVAKTAAQLANAGLEGGVRSFSDSEESDVGDRLQGAAGDAVKSAAISALIGGAVNGAAGAASKLNKWADINRVASTGTYGSDLRNMVDNKGEQYVSDLAGKIEELGLHKNQSDNPIVRAIANRIPASAGRYAENAQSLMNSAGKRMGAAEAAIGELASPPTVNMNKVIEPMEERIQFLGKRSDPAAAGASPFRGGELSRPGGEAGFRGDFTNNLKANSMQVDGPGMKTQYAQEWPEALAERRYIDDQVNWNRKGGYEGAGMQEQVRREVAGNLRAGTKEALDLGVERGTVPQDLAGNWRSGNDDYAVGAAVRDPAIARVYKDYGNQQISLPAWSTGDPVAGLVAQGMKTYGRSLAAGTQRGLANVAAAVSPTGLQSAVNAPATSAALGAGMTQRDPMTEQAISALAGKASAQTPQPPTSNDSHGEIERAGQSQGQNLGKNIERALATNPQVFGPYLSQFQEVKGDPDRLTALAERLSLDTKDPHFKRTVWPLLTGATR